MLTPPFTGRCLCGAVTWRGTAPPLWQRHCHCDSCRRATSSPFTSFIGMADGRWEWTGAPPATYESSPGTFRAFCPTCGAPLAYHTDRIPGERHFHAATLDDPTAYAPTLHEHTDEQLPWITLCDGLPRT